MSYEVATGGGINNNLTSSTDLFKMMVTPYPFAIVSILLPLLFTDRSLCCFCFVVAVVGVVCCRVAPPQLQPSSSLLGFGVLPYPPFLLLLLPLPHIAAVIVVQLEYPLFS